MVIYDIFITFVQVIIVLVFLIVTVLFLVWWERKISAHMQVRLGPMRTGGWHGWAQTIADAIKLFLKEDIVPECADKWLHLLAPVIVFIPAFLCYAVIPFGENLSVADIDLGILYIFAISSITVIGVIIAGWSSGNKYSLIGGLRAGAQMISYEIPRILSIVPVLMSAESLNMNRIVKHQHNYHWFIFYPVVGIISFFIYLTSSIAETNRVPFDIPEAESELVSGYNTEYSGLKFAFFFLAEFLYMFLASCIATTLFLGGGNGPILPSSIWFLLKTYFIVFIFMWVRWTLPRLRVDRMMEFNWKFLIPLSFANILLAGFVLLFI
ncbi:MAG: NADH-quinone oxidoreductase subunit NuoH [Elusimicrobia bacterium]|nr:NADH-quinone oxidoreductase subunit NuoH [Elusimicrobiota bacterium]